MPEYNVIVPGTPIAKKRPRFARRGRFVTTYNDQETEEGKFLLLARQQIPKMAPAGEAVELICRFIFPIPKSTSKKAYQNIVERGYVHVKKPDADNCLKFVKDCLNGVAWHDDSQVFLVVAQKEYGAVGEVRLIIKWQERINHSAIGRVNTLLPKGD